MASQKPKVARKPSRDDVAFRERPWRGPIYMIYRDRSICQSTASISLKE